MTSKPPRKRKASLRGEAKVVNTVNLLLHRDCENKLRADIPITTREYSSPSDRHLAGAQSNLVNIMTMLEPLREALQGPLDQRQKPLGRLLREIISQIAHVMNELTITRQVSIVQALEARWQKAGRPRPQSKFRFGKNLFGKEFTIPFTKSRVGNNPEVFPSKAPAKSYSGYLLRLQLTPATNLFGNEFTNK